MPKVEIDINKQLQPGDIIELHFITLGMGWITAAQIALIEGRLERRKDFTILAHSLPENNKIVFTVRINKTNPVMVTAAIIAGLIIGAGVVAWLTLDKVYQIMESPAGQVGMIGFGTLSAVAAVAIILALLAKSK